MNTNSDELRSLSPKGGGYFAIVYDSEEEYQLMCNEFRTEFRGLITEYHIDDWNFPEFKEVNDLHSPHHFGLPYSGNLCEILHKTLMKLTKNQNETWVDNITNILYLGIQGLAQSVSSMNNLLRPTDSANSLKSYGFASGFPRNIRFYTECTHCGNPEVCVETQGVAESSGRSKSAIFGRDEVSYENQGNSYELRSPEFPRTPSAARPEYFTVAESSGRSKSAIFGRDEVSYENQNKLRRTSFSGVSSYSFRYASGVLHSFRQRELCNTMIVHMMNAILFDLVDEKGETIDGCENSGHLTQLVHIPCKLCSNLYIISHGIENTCFNCRVSDGLAEAKP